MFRGLARQPHNDVCRERLRGILKEGAKVKNAEGRRKDFEDKELEKKRKKEEKREKKIFSILWAALRFLKSMMRL